MKNANASELKKQFKECPTQVKEYMIGGRKFIVISHFTGKKNLDEIVFKNSYKKAMAETLRT